MNRLILIIYFLFYLHLSFAQKIVYTEVSTRNQLPAAEITCILPDSEGFVWYGTNGGGVFRDDGYTVIPFRSDFNNPELLGSNDITDIAEDKINNRIWIGTKRGVYVLDKSDYHVYPLNCKELKSKSVNSLNIFSDGSIWISSNEKLYRLKNENSIPVIYPVIWDGYPKSVYDLYEDPDQQIWMLQWKGGILKYDSDEDNFIPLEWPFVEGPTCIIKDVASSNYWIGTWGNGIIRFNPTEKDVDKMYVTQDLFLNSGIDRKMINSIVQDSFKNYLWVTAMDDLYAYEITETGTLIAVNTEDFLPPGEKIVHNVTVDYSGNLWVSGDYPNAFIISFQQNESFKKINLPQVKNNIGIPVSPVKMLFENGNFWFWQKRSGLWVCQPESGIFDTYSKNDILAYLQKSNHRNGVYTI
ncbi:MAG: hypothetical protein LUF90_01475 [Rikenellaceae bacterium]|nr:hypothetical protein [Rikenellaceae bacterium]